MGCIMHDVELTGLVSFKCPFFCDYDFTAQRVDPISIPEYKTDRDFFKLVYNWNVREQTAFKKVEKDWFGTAFIIRKQKPKFC